jgi:hypothetical protein
VIPTDPKDTLAFEWKSGRDVRASNDFLSDKYHTHVLKKSQTHGNYINYESNKQLAIDHISTRPTLKNG